MSHPAPGARSSRRRPRLDVTTVLAVLLPLLTVGALLLARPGDPAAPTRPPTRTALTTASLVCPSALPGAPAAHLSTAERGVSGTVTLAGDDDDGDGGDPATATLRQGRVTAVERAAGPLRVTGEGELAPGLVGARFGSGTLAAVGCAATAPERWFTAVGAGARHSSVLELVNPDAGPAVADITVLAGRGPVDVPRLRGVSVPGRSSVRIDLGAMVPRRGELALHVLTSRGRLGAAVLDRYDELGAGRRTEDWLPAQAAPSTRNTLLGLAAGAGTRTLVLANPGADEARATLKVVTEDSVFAPSGVDELRIAPGGVRRVVLGEPVLSAIRDGALGLEVTSTVPLTSTLRSLVDGELSHAVAADAVSTRATVVVPEGDTRVVLAGATTAGVVSVVGWSASGERLPEARTEVRPGRGAVVGVPERAVLVSVVPARTPVLGAVVVTGDGTAVLPLQELLRNGLVPHTRPGLP